MSRCSVSELNVSWKISLILGTSMQHHYLDNVSLTFYNNMLAAVLILKGHDLYMRVKGQLGKQGILLHINILAFFL